MAAAFDKSAALFPVKEQLISLNHCGVSPTYGPAARAEIEFAEMLARFGSACLDQYPAVLKRFRAAGAKLFRTVPENIAFIPSCAFGINLIANGFPFGPADEIVSYRYEYPSNHYPWANQLHRAATLRLIEGKTFRGRPLSFTLEDIEKVVSARTRILALSHVQFTSGFAADLGAIGRFCTERDIVFVVDAAQSVGCMPLYPEDFGIDAVVVSGWKWLLGPIGSGIMYTTPRLRSLLNPTMVGPSMVVHAGDYLNHSFNPFQDSRVFEYSTVPISIVSGIEKAISQGIGAYKLEEIWSEAQRLGELFLSVLKAPALERAPLEPAARSGILSFVPAADRPERLETFAAELGKLGVICTVRGNYLRFAPHYYLDEAEVIAAAEKVNELSTNLVRNRS